MWGFCVDTICSEFVIGVQRRRNSFAKYHHISKLFGRAGSQRIMLESTTNETRDHVVIKVASLTDGIDVAASVCFKMQTEQFNNLLSSN